MKDIKLKAWGNIFLFFGFLISAFSGLVLEYVLPYGSGFRGGRGLIKGTIFLGFERGKWMDIHTYSSLIFLGLVVVHLVLYWSWIKNLPKLLKGGENDG
jgi:hypothetical protein